jgi:magnesium transporter
MEQQPHPLPETETTEQDPSRNSQVQVLAQETRKLFEAGEDTAALAFFRQIHPADQGEILVGLARESRQELLTRLTPDEVAQILDHIEPVEALRLFEGVEAPVVSQILDEASPDVAADILKDLPLDQSWEILGGMRDTEEVVPLLQHPDDTAGGVMIPDYPVVRESISAGNALDELRFLSPDAEDISSIFVVDDENKLVGTLSVTRLALARPHVMVGDIAHREFIAVRTDTDQEESARLMEHYNLNQLPVVDQEGHLRGVILAEDMVDVVEEEATEDMYRMAGVAGERVFGPLKNSLRNRVPWLYMNLATAFLAALVISFFESTIAQVAALAVFLPVVAGQGGIGGTQTVTIIVRSMALGEVPATVGVRLLVRELTLGLINGTLLGVIVGVIASAWKGNPFLGVVLGVAMMGNMLIAAMAGAGVPLLLRRLHLDPAVSSAVFVTTFTDVFGFLLFLGLAAAFINFLL